MNSAERSRAEDFGRRLKRKGLRVEAITFAEDVQTYFVFVNAKDSVAVDVKVLYDMARKTDTTLKYVIDTEEGLLCFLFMAGDEDRISRLLAMKEVLTGRNHHCFS